MSKYYQVTGHQLWEEPDDYFESTLKDALTVAVRLQKAGWQKVSVKKVVEIDWEKLV